MQDYLADIINVIDSVFSEPSLPAESHKYLKTAEDALGKLGNNVKEELVRHYSNAAAPEDNPVSRLFYLYDLLGDPIFSKKLDKYIEKITSPSDFTEVFWNIARRNFVKPSEGFATEELRNVFQQISRKVKMFLSEKNFCQRKKVGQIRKIAIISPQILGMRHSPTREAFSIALHLEKYHSCDVYIFNTNGLNYTNKHEIYNPFIANHVANFKVSQCMNVDYMEFRNKSIQVVSFPAERMSTRKIADILQTIFSLEIDAVISHGENLFIQDSIYEMVPSIFATTGGVVPFAHCDAYWVPENLWREEFEEIAVRYGHTDFMKESMLVTPEGKAEGPANRASFSLPEDAIVYLVVSTRMKDEIDGTFSDICRELLDKNKRAHILLAGTNDLDLASLFDESLVLEGRIVSAGFQNDLPTICLMSDIYLNPYRQGGGTSSQTAILNGLPVVTMNYGHISAVVPADRRHESWEDYVSYAIRLGGDPDYLAAEQNLFLEHFSDHLQTKDQIRKIYNKLQQIAAEKYQR